MMTQIKSPREAYRPPVIYVHANYPGASADTVQGFVTTPLQRRIAAAKGVEYVTSQSNPGMAEIQVWVRLGENSTEGERGPLRAAT